MWEQTEHIFVESLQRVVGAVARLLPGLVALVLIVGLSLAVAALLRAVVLRIGERLAVDRRLRQWGVTGPVEEGKGPTRLVARLLAWTVLAVGFLAGLSAVDAATMSTLAVRMLFYVPNVVVAVVILFIGIASSRAVERGVLIGSVNAGFRSARLLGLAVRWLVVILTVALALEHLGVGGRVVPVALGILFGGIVLALSLAIGLGAKDVVTQSLAKRFQPGPHPLDDVPEEDRIKHL
jgi:hypothetical protein